MTDMLVRLYDLAPVAPDRERQSRRAIAVRRAMAYERGIIMQWVERQFGPRWADECQCAFGRHPVGCHIAIAHSAICGFCCTDCTFRGFLGPIGIQSDFRGKGVGRLLLLTALESMRGRGYAYAVVGNVGNAAFFERSAGAVAIEGSTPGPYPESLKS
jgi:ribosomal protein S18 acetylase RimI-like enzyme